MLKKLFINFTRTKFTFYSNNLLNFQRFYLATSTKKPIKALPNEPLKSKTPEKAKIKESPVKKENKESKANSKSKEKAIVEKNPKRKKKEKEEQEEEEDSIASKSKKVEVEKKEKKPKSSKSVSKEKPLRKTLNKEQENLEAEMAAELPAKIAKEKKSSKAASNSRSKSNIKENKEKEDLDAEIEHKPKNSKIGNKPKAEKTIGNKSQNKAAESDVTDVTDTKKKESKNLSKKKTGKASSKKEIKPEDTEVPDLADDKDSKVSVKISKKKVSENVKEEVKEYKYTDSEFLSEIGRLVEKINNQPNPDANTNEKADAKAKEIPNQQKFENEKKQTFTNQPLENIENSKEIETEEKADLSDLFPNQYKSASLDEKPNEFDFMIESLNNFSTDPSKNTIMDTKQNLVEAKTEELFSKESKPKNSFFDLEMDSEDEKNRNNKKFTLIEVKAKESIKNEFISNDNNKDTIMELENDLSKNESAYKKIENLEFAKPSKKESSKESMVSKKCFFSIREFSFHEALLYYYERHKRLFDSSKDEKTNPKLAHSKESILKTLPENSGSESLQSQAALSFYELIICNIATIKFGKELIDELRKSFEKIKLTQDSIINVFFDGGCSGLNSTGVCGVVCYVDKTRLFKVFSNIGPLSTNNTAEYMALIYGLYLLSLLNMPVKVVFLGDSQLVIKQMRKEFKITKSNIIILNEIANLLLKRIENYEFVHIARNLNAEADNLANQAKVYPNYSVILKL